MGNGVGGDCTIVRDTRAQWAYVTRRQMRLVSMFDVTDVQLQCYYLGGYYLGGYYLDGYYLGVQSKIGNDVVPAPKDSGSNIHNPKV